MNLLRHLTGILLLLCLALPALAQPVGDSERRRTVGRKPKYRLTRQIINLPSYDDRLIHYGFFLAANYSNFRVKPSQTFTSNILNQATQRNPLWSMQPVGAVGFTTGFILNVRLNAFADARFLPTVAFYQRYIQFRYRNDSSSVQLNQSTYSFVELPFLVKLKSQRRGNFRMYLVGGIKPSFEVGAKRDEIDDSFLRTRKTDLAIDYGLGFDIYYPLFKFSPEIRFSHGIANMKYPDDNIYANSLNRLSTHTITIFLNFE